MKFLPLLCLLLPVFLFGQSGHPSPDPLYPPLPAEASARLQAERLDKIIWQIFLEANLQFGTYAGQLDSLYRCCILGKTRDPDFEKTIGARATFFLGASLMEEQPEASQPLLKDAIRQFALMGDSTFMALSYTQLTYTASRLGDSLASAAYLDQSALLVKHVPDPFLKSIVLSDMGINCYIFGRYAEAAANYFQALELVEKYRTPSLLNLQHDIYHNLNGIYNRLEDWDNALNYMKKAIQCAKERGQDPAVHCVGLANSYIGKKEYRLALEVLLEAEKKLQSEVYSNMKAAINYTLSNCYRNLGDVNAALTCAQKAVKLLPVSTNAPQGAISLEELAHCEFALGRTDQALRHALLAYETYVSSKQNGGLVRITALLSNIYKAQGDFRKALQFSELRFKFQNLVERQQSARQLAFGEFTRENEAIKARREAEVKAELDQQRNIRFGLFAGMGVLLLLALLLYNRYRYKQRTAQKLEAQNLQIEAARSVAEEQRQRAEASEAFKSRFLANMSHEIRTPLHGISGYTEMLLHTALQEKQLRWLSSIRQSTDRLSEVVNDILDLSKLEAGEMKLRKLPFSVRQLAHDVQEALALKAADKGITFALQLEGAVPEAAIGDPTRLFQILMNLAGNAVKFTEVGSVVLAVSVENTDHADNLASLRFSISDTGAGIPTEQLSTIFDNFQQVTVAHPGNQMVTRADAGTGLGLSIARELVRLHGSDIEVESTLGKGSVFSFVITVPTAAAASVADNQPFSEALVYHTALRILLADDNEFNREIAVEALHRHFENVEVVEAVNGREAVSMLENADAPFDLVLMDMQMPEMTGMDATHYIRQHLSKELPIIALTASATPQEVELALASGMDRHLGKPFKPHELANVVAETLQLPGRQTEMTPTPVTTHAQLPMEGSTTAEGFDLRFLHDFCAGDTEQMQHFIRKFMEQYPQELKRLKRALEFRDRAGISQAAHNFKPQLEFVGLKKTSALMQEIEQGARSAMTFTELESLAERVAVALEGQEMGG